MQKVQITFIDGYILLFKDCQLNENVFSVSNLIGGDIEKGLAKMVYEANNSATTSTNINLSSVLCWVFQPG